MPILIFPPFASASVNHSKTLAIDRVRMLEGTPDVDLDAVGSTKVGAMVVEVIDPVEDYLKVRYRVRGGGGSAIMGFGRTRACELLDDETNPPRS